MSPNEKAVLSIILWLTDWFWSLLVMGTTLTVLWLALRHSVNP